MQWPIGYSEFWQMLTLFRKYDILRGDRASMVERLQAIGPLVKKAGMLLPDKPCSRSTDEQTAEKSKPAPDLEAYDAAEDAFSNEHFLVVAKRLIKDLLIGLIGDQPLQKDSPERSYRDRLGYEAGGSSSLPPIN
eukprot:2468795-Amphidinium_carterae.1